jgi:hypothetical protein
MWVDVNRSITRRSVMGCARVPPFTQPLWEAVNSTDVIIAQSICRVPFFAVGFKVCNNRLFLVIEVFRLWGWISLMKTARATQTQIQSKMWVIIIRAAALQALKPWVQIPVLPKKKSHQDIIYTDPKPDEAWRLGFVVWILSYNALCLSDKYHMAYQVFTLKSFLLILTVSLWSVGQGRPHEIGEPYKNCIQMFQM